MNKFEANYDKILKVLKSIIRKDSFLVQRRKPKLNDIELIAINLTAEFMSIDSECQLFIILPCKLFSRVERSVYNRRKRKLFEAIENIRYIFSEKFNEFEKYFVVDSMPLK